MDPLSEKAAKNTPIPPFTWVATTAAFEEMLHTLRQAARIALDIEADSLYHYFEKVCLLQLSTDEMTFVVDPLALKDLSGLEPILADSAVEKVVHAASYDVHCLRRDFRFRISHLFDTHLAAQLLGYEQLGLSALLEILLGVSHSKGRQRDDWSRRPLDREQLEYAAMDTHFLLVLRDILESQLLEKGRADWAEEEFEIAANSEQLVREFDPEGYHRIKGSQDLSPLQMAVLRALYLLRDRYARDMDLPPFKVLNSPILLDLARRPPQSPQALFRRAGISRRIAANFAEEIFKTIEKARAEDTSTLVQKPRIPWKRPSADAKVRLEQLKNWRQSKSQELHLPVGVVFPGSILESLAAAPASDEESLAKHDGMRRWRIREFGGDILKALGSS